MYYSMSVAPVEEFGRRAVQVTIANCSALLTVDDIDALIDTLGEIRSGMQPARPLEPPASRHYPLQMDPSWCVDRNPLFDGVILILRHAGVGWTAFAFPQPSLSRLNGALSAQVGHAFDISVMPS
jgi:hypothetical protein